MTDARIERLAQRLLEALSDRRVCGLAEDALRNQIRRELNAAATQPIPQGAVDHVANTIAGPVRNACEGLRPEVRAAGVIVAAAGAVYGVSQMPEEEIRRIIARASPRISTDLGFLGAQDVELIVAPSLAPLVGGDPSVSIRIERELHMFGSPVQGRLSANDLGTGNANFGVRLNGTVGNQGTWSFGGNAGNGDTSVFFRLGVQF